jgi:hypothetical protein
MIFFAGTRDSAVWPGAPEFCAFSPEDSMAIAGDRRWGSLIQCPKAYKTVQEPVYRHILKDILLLLIEDIDVEQLTAI